MSGGASGSQALGAITNAASGLFGDDSKPNMNKGGQERIKIGEADLRTRRGLDHIRVVELSGAERAWAWGASAGDSGAASIRASAAVPTRASRVLRREVGSSVAMGGDGQVTLGNIVVKQTARKVRRVGNGNVIAGFAGHTASWAVEAPKKRRLPPGRNHPHVVLPPTDTFVTCEPSARIVYC